MIEMETLNDLGIMQLRSNLGAAASSHEAALEIAQELGDTAAETNALDRLAVISLAPARVRSRARARGARA